MLLMRHISAADSVIQMKKVAVSMASCSSWHSICKITGYKQIILTFDTSALVVRSQIDTKHDIRADSCSRGNRLLAQPAKAQLVGKKAGDG